DDPDPLALELLRQRTQQYVIAQRPAPGDHRQGARVGLEFPEEPRLGDATHHDRTGDSGLFERLDDAVELPGVNPGDRSHGLAQAVVGLADVRHRDHADAPAASGFGEENREATAASDEPDALHGHQRQIPRWEPAMKSSSWATSGTVPSSRRTSAMCSR